VVSAEVKEIGETEEPGVLIRLNFPAIGTVEPAEIEGLPGALVRPGASVWGCGICHGKCQYKEETELYHHCLSF